MSTYSQFLKMTASLTAAALLTSIVQAQESRLLTPLGDVHFSDRQLMSGSFSDQQQCAGLPEAVWVVVQGRGDCIRYFSAGLRSGENSEALVFMLGDRLEEKNGATAVIASYLKDTPNSFRKSVEHWASQAKRPFILLARPGTYGSSGNHGQRRQLREVLLVNAAINEIKARHGIVRLHIGGQSSGGHLAASMLNMRRDIGCAAISSGVVAVRARNQAKGWPGDITGYRDFYDPVDHIANIARNPMPTIFVIYDLRDRRVPYVVPQIYLARLRQAGFNPVEIRASAKPPNYHGLAHIGRPVLRWCAGGMSVPDIVQRVNSASSPEE